MMWNFPLCAVITINEKRNCFGPIAEQNLARQGKLNGMLGKRSTELGNSYVAPPETDAGWNLAGKPQPHGDTQITRNGLH